MPYANYILVEVIWLIRFIRQLVINNKHSVYIFSLRYISSLYTTFITLTMSKYRANVFLDKHIGVVNII